MSTTDDDSNRAAERNQHPAQPDLPGWGPGGRGFESRRSPLKKAVLARAFCPATGQYSRARGYQTGTKLAVERARKPSRVGHFPSKDAATARAASAAASRLRRASHVLLRFPSSRFTTLSGSMKTVIVLGAGASLANGLKFRRHRRRDTLPPLDTTFFETVAARRIELGENLRPYLASVLKLDLSTATLREQPMEQVFKDVFYDFNEAQSDEAMLNAYVDLWSSPVFVDT